MKEKKTGAGLILVFAFAMIVVLCSPSALRAQEVRGTIKGRVLDPNKAAIPGASVKVTDVARGTTVTLSTNDDGLFRKYRIVVVDGRPYACHMAIADRWDIWYLNADMAFSESKRREEENFMRSFDSAFAVRHQSALAAMTDRLGLDYFTIDCAENKRGELLIFEADNTAVVHNMDSPELFPYKPPQMRAIFEAFAAMLYRGARRGREHAA